MFYIYILAAIAGFFTCPIACLFNGIYAYDFGWVDLFMAALYAGIVWWLHGKLVQLRKELHHDKTSAR